MKICWMMCMPFDNTVSTHRNLSNLSFTQDLNFQNSGAVTFGNPFGSDLYL